MQIPVEVIVKYNEAGQIIPLKLILQDNIYIIDRIGDYKLTTPRGSFGVALEYTCSIDGCIKRLYFDRYNSRWYIFKDTKKNNIHAYNPLNYDV